MNAIEASGTPLFFWACHQKWVRFFELPGDDAGHRTLIRRGESRRDPALMHCFVSALGVGSPVSPDAVFRLASARANWLCFAEFVRTAIWVLSKYSAAQAR